MSTGHLTETCFDSFDLHKKILQGIEKSGFSYCTPIQAKTLPIALEGQDVAGQAQTGTGKTAAFLLAIFQNLLNKPKIDHNQKSKITQPDALILAPTRELAVQIHKDAELLGAYTDLKLGLVFGGTGYEQQRRRLEAGVDILIGTPGRLIDYFKQGIFNLKSIRVVVLDEADRMFDLGFIKDIRYLLRRCPAPEQRLGMLFSATLSYRVMELAYEYMNSPKMVKAETDKVAADKITHVCYMTANEEKISPLVGLLRQMDTHRTIIFVNTKRGADLVWGFLEGNGFKAAVLSGDVPQKKRLRLLEGFQSGDMPILVATDVAARGLHISDVTHVINYDLPEDAADYVHRIGRTARAGAHGDAISFVCETHAFSLPEIEAFLGHKLPIKAVTNDLLAEIDSNSRVRVKRRQRRQAKSKKGKLRTSKDRSDVERKNEADTGKQTVGEPKKRRRRRRRPSKSKE